ncbi:helix-turn-helix transcriptional regulator [Actinomadura keratinilytica]
MSGPHGTPRPGVRPRPGLAAARKRLGMTQEQAAEAAGVSTTTWARWEQGTQDLRANSRARLVELFGVSPEEVDRWVDGEQFESVAPWLSSGAGYASMAVTVESCVELWRWDVDPARRRILASMPFVPAVLGEWLLSWRLDPGDETRARTGSGPSVGVEDVQRIQQAHTAFDQMDRQFGGGLVRPAVVAYLDDQVTPLLNGKYTDEVGGQLVTAAALMTALAGWEAFDLGMQGLAQMHYGQALKLAKAADDELTAARVLSIMAQQAIDLDQPQWAVRLAAAAHRAGLQAQAPPRVVAMLLLREATAAALSVASADNRDAHTEKRVRRLVSSAETTFAKAGPNDEEPAWIMYFGPAEFAAQAGYCWQLIGDHKSAIACAETAVRGFGSRFPRAAQFNTVHVATSRLGLGELDGALESAKAAIPMANTLTSRRSLDLVKAFDAKLGPYRGEQKVKEWRDYMRAELRTTGS